MAYLLTHFWPGATQERYGAAVAVVERAFNGQPHERVAQVTTLRTG